MLRRTDDRRRRRKIEVLTLIFLGIMSCGPRHRGMYADYLPNLTLVVFATQWDLTVWVFFSWACLKSLVLTGWLDSVNVDSSHRNSSFRGATFRSFSVDEGMQRRWGSEGQMRRKGGLYRGISAAYGGWLYVGVHSHTKVQPLFRPSRSPRVPPERRRHAMYCILSFRLFLVMSRTVFSLLFLSFCLWIPNACSYWLMAASPFCGLYFRRASCLFYEFR